MKKFICRKRKFEEVFPEDIISLQYSTKEIVLINSPDFNPNDAYEVYKETINDPSEESGIGEIKWIFKMLILNIISKVGPDVNSNKAKTFEIIRDLSGQIVTINISDKIYASSIATFTGIFN